MKTRPLADRFWEKVEKTNYCWVWKACKDPKGYGYISVARSVACLAHRVAWELENGPIPEGKQILHRCDNPSCVRNDGASSHLFLGDAAQNARDMFIKGRSRQGERHHNCKLTTKQVKEIRLRYHKGEAFQKDLAKEYGVSKQAISTLIRGDSWQNVE